MISLFGINLVQDGKINTDVNLNIPLVQLKNLESLINKNRDDKDKFNMLALGIAAAIVDDVRVNLTASDLEVKPDDLITGFRLVADKLLSALRIVDFNLIDRIMSFAHSLFVEKMKILLNEYGSSTYLMVTGGRILLGETFDRFNQNLEVYNKVRDEVANLINSNFEM